MRRGFDVAESTTFGFFYPFFTITIATKQNVSAVPEVATQDFGNDLFLFRTLLLHGCIHFFLEFHQLVAHDGIQHNHICRAVITAAHGAEFKLISGEGKR